MIDKAKNKEKNFLFFGTKPFLKQKSSFVHTFKNHGENHKGKRENTMENNNICQLFKHVNYPTKEAINKIDVTNNKINKKFFTIVQRIIYIYNCISFFC